MSALFRTLFALIAMALTLGLAVPARAHEVGLSRSDLRSGEAGLAVELAFARKDLIAIEPSLDANKDGGLDASEVGAPPSTAAIAAALALKGDAGSCAPKLGSITIDADDGAIVHLSYAACDGTIMVDASKLLAALSSEHRHVSFVYPPAGDPEEHLLRAGRTSYTTAAYAIVPVAPPAPPTAGETAWAYFVLGIEHILFGIDHVVFLMGLILIGGRFRQLAIMITAFTASHSVTLALAVLGVVAPSPSIIEPIIALSVAYVGVENFIVKDAAKRWRVAGVFGLIHGFGFAGALGDVGLPQANIPLALATFNVGVEIGQLALLGVTLPIVLWLRKRDWFVPRGVQVLSGAVVLAGLLWFVERVLPGA